MATEFDRQIHQDLLNRLRWNLLGDLEDAKIASGPYDRTTYLPFFEHPAANQSLTEPPTSRIEAFSQDCARKRDMEFAASEEYRYKLPPPNLGVTNEDGRPITLGQFVREVHAYLNRPENMEVIKDVKSAFRGRVVMGEDGSQGREMTYGRSESLPDGTEIFFAWVVTYETEEAVVIGISLFLDGETSVDAERFWASRLRKAQWYEQV
ncbi:hypothetical protein N0V95_010155 [Ascochyta clinopodiicola]|nr:hypothetical protein N0V95_010155 [Ascochyta clinopodiicola]